MPFKPGNRIWWRGEQRIKAIFYLLAIPLKALIKANLLSVEICLLLFLRVAKNYCALTSTWQKYLLFQEWSKKSVLLQNSMETSYSSMLGPSVLLECWSGGSAWSILLPHSLNVSPSPWQGKGWGLPSHSAYRFLAKRLDFLSWNLVNGPFRSLCTAKDTMNNRVMVLLILSPWASSKSTVNAVSGFECVLNYLVFLFDKVMLNIVRIEIYILTTSRVSTEFL